MKLRWIIALTGGVLLASQLGAEQTLTLKSQREKVSYMMGVDIGKNLRTQSADIDLDILARGIKDAFSAGKLLLTEQEIRETLTIFQKEMIAKQQALMAKNKKDAEAFLAEDKKKEGIVTLPSGLQYKVIKPGIGRKPKPTDTVSVHYRATLIDGTEFSNSYLLGQPEFLRVNEVIPGLAEALTLMQEGAKWLLYIPPNLGYGERGAGSQIGPNASLIFDVELISIQGNP
jgi:FKBP-type peptidyl-prolyl cis-trans isomerase FklB